MSNRKSLIVLALVAVALLAGGLMGAWLRPAKPTSVAVVDWLAVTTQLEELKAQRATLDAEVKKKNEDRQSRAARIQEIREQLQSMPPDAPRVRELSEQLEMETSMYQAWWQATQGQLSRNELSMQIDTYEAIVKAVGEVAKRDGWEIVLWDDAEGMKVDRTNLQSTVEAIARRHMLYSVDAIDITEDVIQYMNNNYRVGN